ncbi:MAG: hypothetical protein WBQ60_06585 [Asticcacaulis sp.]
MNGILIACALLIAMMGLSLYLSRSNWPFHPAGKDGYIRDMLIYFFLPVTPMLVAVTGFGLLTYFYPQYESATARYVLMGVAIVGLLFVRRLPFVAAAQNRVRDARNAYYEAMKK